MGKTLLFFLRTPLKKMGAFFRAHLYAHIFLFLVRPFFFEGRFWHFFEFFALFLQFCRRWRTIFTFFVGAHQAPFFFWRAHFFRNGRFLSAHFFAHFFFSPSSYIAYWKLRKLKKYFRPRISTSIINYYTWNLRAYRKKWLGICFSTKGPSTYYVILFTV